MNEKKYEEIGTNYRFFLGWRHASFAGYLVILYGVVGITMNIFKEAPNFVWIVPLIASPIGILLWIIDSRTRDLYHAAINAGKDLEGLDGGFYTRLSKDVVMPAGSSPFSKKTQTGAIKLLFIGFSTLLFLYGFINFLIWVCYKLIRCN